MSPGYNPSPKRRLVGQPLIYTMTVFISLGVFLVRTKNFRVFLVRVTNLQHSLAMIKGSYRQSDLLTRV